MERLDRNQGSPRREKKKANIDLSSESYQFSSQPSVEIDNKDDIHSLQGNVAMF
jgi:hypothetical protein